jgi:WD40 repeat protein
VALVDGWRYARLYDLDSGALLGEHDYGDTSLRSVEFSSDEAQLVVGRLDAIELVDPSTWKAAARRDEAHPASTRASLSCSPDGRRIAYTVTSGRVHVCARDTLELELELQVSSSAALGVAFAPDGARLATTHRDVARGEYGIDVWSLDGTPVWRAETSALEHEGSTLHFGPWTPAFSADGKYLAAGGWDDLIVVWEAGSGRVRSVLRDHQAVVWDVAFHPDDRNLLVSASDDGTAKLWDVGNERCLATFVSPEDRDEVTMSVGFGSGGKQLVVGGFGGATIWDLGYFERHIAGNLPLQRDRLEQELGARIDRAAFAAWSRRVLAGEE